MASLSHINLLFFLTLPIIWVFGVQQEIMFYTEDNQGGEGVLFRSSQSDLTGYSAVMNGTKSYCSIGLWALFEEKDFISYYGISWGSLSEAKYCRNYPSGRVESLRHFGVLDTTTPALSLYEIVFWGSRELVLTGEALANFPFPPRSFVSSGNTNWTFYAGPNFEGNSTCYATPTNILFVSNIANVGSVAKGCGLEAQRNIELYNLSLCGN